MASTSAHHGLRGQLTLELLVVALDALAEVAVLDAVNVMVGDQVHAGNSDACGGPLAFLPEVIPSIAKSSPRRFDLTSIELAWASVGGLPLLVARLAGRGPPLAGLAASFGLSGRPHARVLLVSLRDLAAHPRCVARRRGRAGRRALRNVLLGRARRS